MAKFMTAARKITLARLVGIGAGTGLMQALTKDLSVVCPVAGLALVGAAVLHHRMKDLPEESSVTLSDMASVAGQAAGEVALLSSITAVAKNGYKSFRGDAAPAVDIPVADVAPVADITPVV